MVGTTEGSPLITILFSFLLKMEKINIYQVGGLILVYAGRLITITKGNFNVVFPSGYSSGDILLLLNTICLGAYNILTKYWKVHIEPNVFMFYFFLYECLTLSPLLIYEGSLVFYKNTAKIISPIPLLAIIVYGYK